MKKSISIAAFLLAACGTKSPTTDGAGERHKENPVADDKATASGGGPTRPTSTDPHEAEYARLLGGQRQPAAKIVEDEGHKIADWRFFQLREEQASGMIIFSGRAAVDGSGHAVAPRLTGDSAWHAFLTADGLDAAGALERLAWLFEAAPVSRSGDHAPISDSKARALVTDPVIERTSGGVRFIGWFARPPDFDPWRTTIEAPATGAAKVAEEMWHKLPPR